MMTFFFHFADKPMRQKYLLEKANRNLKKIFSKKQQTVRIINQKITVFGYQSNVL